MHVVGFGLLLLLLLFCHLLQDLVPGDSSAEGLAVEVDGDEQEEEVYHDVEQQPVVFHWVVGFAFS